MGQEVVKTVIQDTDDNLVGVYDKSRVGEDIMEIIGLEGPKVLINDNLEELIKKEKPDVIIDFTSPQILMNNIENGLKNGVNMIVGTTGITEPDLNKIRELIPDGTGILIVPNFALGAVLMMKYAAEIAKYMDRVEIIELHHDQKIDAPSGTALKTAEMINQNRKFKEKASLGEIEKLTGARGGEVDGIHIHSVRLPGLVAHQEIIFGGEGQSLTIRHDSYDRTSFMPGVRLALKKISELEGLVYGLEEILD